MAVSIGRTTSNGFIQESSKWAKECGLTIHVVEARGLLNKDLFGGKSNPFVVLKLWGQERVSHVIKNCLSPKWNQTFMFTRYQDHVGDDELVVTLWDKDNVFKNGFLGMVKVIINPLLEHQSRDEWYPLEKRSTKSRVKGTIRLWTQLTFNPRKEPPEIPTFSEPSFPSLSPSFSMPALSAALDGASPSNAPFSSRSSDRVADFARPNYPTHPHQLVIFSPESQLHGNISPNNSPTLDESDFLHIEPVNLPEPVKEDKGKGKGKGKEEWQSLPPSPNSYPLPSPPTPHFQQQLQQLQQHIYYDAYGDPVDDPDMIAILKMEEEEKRAKELEEDRLLREYLSTLQRCSECGSEDGGDPLVLPCDHCFCRACLASHIRLLGKIRQPGRHSSNIPCPTCESPVPEWAMKRALPVTEYEAILNQSLQSFIDSGTGIFRCPTSTCGAPIERIPYQPKPNQNGQSNDSITEHHREEYRFRCRSCSTEFCSGCMAIPYHVGYTCEGYSRYLKAKHCRFCAVTLDGIGNASSTTNDVCKSEECLEKAKLCCKKWHPCGHPCGGILDELQCLPCLQCKAKTDLSEQCSEDYCNICWVESIGSAPAIKLKCGHVFHYTCVKSKLKKRWPAARINFGFSECPLCKHIIEHPALEGDMKPIRDLKAAVQLKASQRLEFEGLSKAKEVTDSSSKFFNNRERYAMDRYAYFMCFKCSNPYFAGQRRCDAGEEEKPFDPADLVCGGCSGSAPAAECATHGKDFLEYKCQFCCTISSWYCWGKTHFCNDCHTKQQKGDYLTKKPKSAIPMCGGVDKCPLKIAHPHCEEFLLGCALCRNVSSF